ncbi:hypothetical protein Gotur_033262 [Gossypium turneri]
MMPSNTGSNTNCHGVSFFPRDPCGLRSLSIFTKLSRWAFNLSKQWTNPIGSNDLPRMRWIVRVCHGYGLLYATHDIRTLLRDVSTGIDLDLDAQMKFGAFQKLGDPTIRRQEV